MSQSTIHVDDQSRLFVESVSLSLLRVLHWGTFAFYCPPGLFQIPTLELASYWPLVTSALEKLCNPFSRFKVCDIAIPVRFAGVTAHVYIIEFIVYA